MAISDSRRTHLKRLLIAALAFVAHSAGAGILHDAPYQVCFTPGGQCTDMIVSAINRAKKNVDLQAYGFTSAPIVKALLHAKARGVDVSTIVDKFNATHTYSAISTLLNNHIPVVIDSKVSIAHNKVMIIDDATVITGSFNFTKSAQTRNAENVLIITDKQLAKPCLDNFNKRLSVSVSPSDYCLSSTSCKIKSITNDAWDATSQASESLYQKAKRLWYRHTGKKPTGYVRCPVSEGGTSDACSHYSDQKACEHSLQLCQEQKGQVEPWMCGTCKVVY